MFLRGGGRTGQRALFMTVRRDIAESVSSFVNRQSSFVEEGSEDFAPSFRLTIDA